MPINYSRFPYPADLLRQAQPDGFVFGWRIWTSSQENAPCRVDEPSAFIRRRHWQVKKLAERAELVDATDLNA